MDFVDGAREPRHVDAEGRVGDALRQERQHDHARHDERAVADPVDLDHVRTDGRTEHHEVQRRGDDRRQHALHQRAPGPGHFKQVDSADGVEVHD
ncbi:hypothetical protein G6F24_018393 [Rhizopus arrhizus]|nr:hypothetical protein G6F24_018393 [Rhizopus arrhizus]